MKAGSCLLIASGLMLLGGCASHKPLEQGQVIERDYFSITWNTATWDFSRSSDEYYVTMEKGNWGDGKGHDSQGININIETPSNFKGKKYWNRFVDIHVHSMSYQEDQGVERYRKHAPKVLFEKNGNLEKYIQEPGSYFDGFVAYNKKWSGIAYLQGMRCMEDAFLRGQADPMKVYSITCGYYDRVKGRRILYITFGYRSDGVPRNNYNSNSSNWKRFSVTGVIPHIQPVEDLTKQAAMQVISTIRLKNLDRERMEREGLMHYDKKFEMSPY